MSRKKFNFLPFLFTNLQTVDGRIVKRSNGILTIRTTNKVTIERPESDVVQPSINYYNLNINPKYQV